MQAVVDCRTERMGGHLFRCSHCDHLRYSYHSCKNRSCPACHESDRKSWLEKRKQEQLPVPYYHAVFTVPKELHEIIRSQQKIFYALLMEAAALSLMKLASDNRYVGGRIGMLSVLHTWTRALVYHPHVHCLIPAGGLSRDNRYWLEARKTYLVPVRALSAIFRATFIALARRNFPKGYSLSRYGTLLGWSTASPVAIQQRRPSLISPGMFTKPPSPTAESFL